MQRSVMLLAVGFALTSCMSFPYVYSQPGHDYRLSWSDLAEINRLANDRSDIRKPLSTISMLGPDYGEVDAGLTQTEGAPMTIFAIHRKNGKWSISDVRQTTVVLTD